MNPKQIEATPGLMLTEYEEVAVDFGAYVKKLPYTKADVARKLDVTAMQLQGWCSNKRVPRAVWKRCALLFAQMGSGPAPKIQKVRNKPYRLPAEHYAKYLGYELVQPAPAAPAQLELPAEPAVPEPTSPAPAASPRPDMIPWSVHEHTIMLLLHQNTEIVRELAAVNTDNLRLQQQVEFLKAQVGILSGDKGFDAVTGRALDAVAPITVEPTDTHKRAVESLKSLSHLNGNGAVLSDLEKRLRPFSAGQRPLS